MISTYPMDNPLLSLHPVTIGFLLSDDKGDGIRDKLSCVGRYGTADSLHGRKGEEDQPQPLYDPVLGRIEAAVNDDPENLIVDGMKETYEFIMDHQIRELILIWDRADDDSNAFMSVPLKN